MKLHWLPVALACTTILACSQQPEPASPPAVESGDHPPAVAPTPGGDLLGRLREALGVTITNDAQDSANWRLAQEVASQRRLVGLRREEIERRIGAGTACGSPWPCGEGYGSEDWYYEVGRLPANMVGGTPVLLVDFDAAGTCVASRTVHTQ